jgi:hypothetical protein
MNGDDSSVDMEVVCLAKVSEYPFLLQAKQNMPLQIEGTIRDIDTHLRIVNLGEATITTR